MVRILMLFLFPLLLLSAQTKFLMPDEAFKPSAAVENATTVAIVVEPAKDIYIYQEQVKIELKGETDVAIRDIVMDKAVEHHGEMVFLEPLHIRVELEKRSDLGGMQDITLALTFQGCSEQGLCYEPITKEYALEIDASKLPSAVAALPSLNGGAPAGAESAVSEKEVLSESGRIAEALKTGSVALVLLTFLGFGLLLSLTPCVFPMIPILSSVIVSQGEGMTTKRAFFLSLVYVLAMSAAYTIAGVLAGLFGSNLQAALQTPWVIISFSLVFVILSFSMFGMYELQLPSFLQSRLTKASESRSGTMGVAIMGFLSALIVGPCVAAPLAGALIYIGQTGDAVLGGMALFALSIGMGIPLLLIGTTAGKYMPRPGAWMDGIKAFFGVMLLAVAIWMISRIIPEPVTLVLWSVLLIFVAVNLGAFEPLGEECVRCSRASKKALGIVLFLYALMLFVGGFTGAANPLDPLERLNVPQTALAAAAQDQQAKGFETIHSVGELEEILAASKGKKVLLDFYADWCVSCKELEHITFADPAVKAKMAEFVLVKADITANSQEEKELTKRFGVFGPPAILFFDENGKQVEGSELIGYQPPGKFLEHLNSL